MRPLPTSPRAWPVRPLAYTACALAFVAHQIAQRLLGISVPLLDAYLDPFLAVPLLLGLAALERWWLRTRSRSTWRGFTGAEVAAMTIALALVFEELFPRLDPLRQVRDGWDYLACGAGGLLYYFLVGVRAGREREEVSLASKTPGPVV